MTITVGEREFQRHIRHYINLAREGHMVLISHRGKPYAELISLHSPTSAAPSATPQPE